MAAAKVESSPASVPRASHLKQLKRLAGSELEQQWLTFLEEGNYRLPTNAQKFMEICQTRPDFLYQDKQVAVFIDGPPHDYSERAERDHQQTECMEDHGWTVIRFGHNDNWDNIISENPNIFGDGS